MLSWEFLNWKQPSRRSTTEAKREEQEKNERQKTKPEKFWFVCVPQQKVSLNTMLRKRKACCQLLQMPSQVDWSYFSWYPCWNNVQNVQKNVFLPKISRCQWVKAYKVHLCSRRHVINANLSMNPECWGVLTVFHSKLYSAGLLEFSGTGTDRKSTHSG